MLTNDQIFEIGFALEERGMSHSEIDAYLAHQGVKGMKWGVRKDYAPGVSNKTNHAAKKDAQEFARAKMFYGEGAGVRRKLIKNTVEAKSKKDPAYAKAFDHHLKNQDLSTHVSKAKAERKRKDVVNTTKKTSRGVKNFMMKSGAPVTLAAVIIGTALSNPQVRAVVKKTANTTLSEAKRQINALQLKQQFRKMGV